MLAGIGPHDLRNRACKTQVARPLLALNFEQAAFFDIPAAIIIAIKMDAFFSGGRFHCKNLYAGNVFARAGVNADDIADINEIGALDRYAGFSFDFLGHACRSIAADGHFSLDHFQIHGGG